MSRSVPETFVPVRTPDGGAPVTARPSRPAQSPMPDGSDEPRDFDAIYHRYGRVVARWAARLGGPAVSVDDVVQDVFLVVSRRLSGFRGEARLRTWLFRITEKTIRNAHRERRRRHWISRLTRRIEEGAPAPQPTPAEQQERREAAEAFYRILEKLPARYRNVLVLHELEAMGTGEIAELLGMKVATVRVCLHRARAAFLRHVQRDGLNANQKLEGSS
jgi:RNA polymerase sigma-70 factor, ECF subfamily